MRTPARAAALALALVAAAACGGGLGPTQTGTAQPAEPAASPYEAVGLPAGPPRPDFTLTDTQGRPYDFRAETAGEPTLLFFGFTNCPDVCPVHLANIAGAFDVRSDVAAVTNMVFVSVDPARDTGPVIRSFLDAIDPSFVGLTGTPEELGRAQDAAGVPRAVGTDGGQVGHAAQVLGYGPDDRLEVQFPFGTRQSTYAHDLAVLADLPVG